MSLHKHAVTGEVRDLDEATLKRIAGTAKGEAWQPYTPPVVPEPIPESVTKRQLFLVLNAERGITRDMLAAMIEQNPNEKERENGLIELQEASAYERNHPLVIQLASALSLTPDDVDHIYRAAAKL